MSQTQINVRVPQDEQDLIDLAVLVHQTVHNDGSFVRTKAAREALNTWAVHTIRDHPDVAQRAAVGLTLGAGASDRDLHLLAENLRLQDHPDDFAAVAGTLDQLAPINPTQPDPAPSTASSSNKPRRR